MDERGRRGHRGMGLSWRWISRWSVLALVLAAIAAYLWLAREPVTLDRLAEHERELREFHDARPWSTAVGALALYIFVAAVVPGAIFLTLAYGWFFGFWQALALVSFGSTAGATIAFLATRFLLRDFISERLNEGLRRIQREADSNGAYYLFSLRLLPMVPFFAVNLAMGLTKIRTWTFWWVSQIGMLPGTAATIYAAAAFPTLEQLDEQGVQGLFRWQLAVALTVVGLLPLVVKKVWDWVGRAATTRHS